MPLSLPLSLPVHLTWDGQPAGPSERVELSLHDAGEHLRVEVRAPFHGDPPPAGPPGPTWALWEHEVVELFLLGEDEHYVELELGPHGHHLLLRLHGRRNIVERQLPLDFVARIEGGRWSGRALLPKTLLPSGSLRGNATAVHGTGETRRYLSHVALGGPEPDFHRLECYLRLPPLGG